MLRALKILMLLLCPSFAASAATPDSVLINNCRAKIKTYRYTKYIDSCFFYFKKALPLALKSSDSVSLYYLYKNLGDAYEHHQLLDSTLAMYDKCELVIPYKNYKLKSFLISDKAYTYKLLYNYDKSSELTMQGMELAELSHQAREISNASLSMAADYAFLKLDAQAIQYYRKAIDVVKKANDKEMLSYAYRYYGEYLLQTKKYEKAFANLKEAERLSAILKDSISLAFVWHHYVDYYWATNQKDSCFYFGKKAEQIFEKRVEYIDLSGVCLQLGECYMKENKLTESEKYFKKAERYVLGDIYFNEKLYSSIADLYNKKGNVKLAYYYLSKSKELSKQIKEKELNGKLAGLRIKYDSDQKEILLKKEKQKSEDSQRVTEQRTTQRNYILMGLFFVFVSLMVVVVSYLKVKRSNKLLGDANKSLEISAKQKQILLKEVHHRVKNNLTMLKSLLYLQAKATNSIDAKLVLEECQLRIQSMALIHQNLYEEGEKEEIEFQHFLKQLFNELELSFKPADKDIRIEFKGTDLELDMSNALFLGLIINELATNSYKYAFENKQEGKIVVELVKIDSNLLLKYSDTGIGLTDDFESTKGGFGFKLLSILTQQLNATIKYSKQNSFSEFVIEIPNV